jgi:hypothetical protein
VRFVLTLLVNGLARVLVSRASRASKTTSAPQAAGGSQPIAGAVAGA